MRKLKKIVIITAICLALVFALQKTANTYIERQINAHLAPYNITANLARLNKLTLNYRGISLTCKIKFKDNTLTLTPIKNSFISELLPDKIIIPIN